MQTSIERARTIAEDVRRAFRKKGEERLTIMIIPHGQERIFSLQLNWFMILFLAGTAALALALAFYGIYLKTAESREAQRLRELYGANFNAALQLNQIALENQALHIKITERLEQIAQTIGFAENQLADLQSADRGDELASAEIDRERSTDTTLSPRASYLPPVRALKALRLSIAVRAPLTDAVADAFRSGIGVYASMPLGRPFVSLQQFNDTSPFGLRWNPESRSFLEFHSGYDMAGAEGTPVMATGRGVVHRTFYDAGYGRAVVIRHDHGFYSMFAHLAQSDLQSGQPVARGQRVGLLGRTGRATGPHLHYEVWLGESERIDPFPFLCALDLESRRCRDFHRGI